MAKYILLEDVTLTFQNNPQFNRYWAALDPAPVLLELGKTYYVTWEGTEWVCTAADGSDAIPGMTFIGNAEDFGIPGNGEPFVIGSSAELGLNFLSTEDQEPVTRTISLSVEEAVPSATVKLKNYSGVEVTYEAVPKVWLASGENEGGSQNLVPFTYGEAREGVEIVPNFVAGDMRIIMPKGYLARSAVVRKPDGLKPENIVAGTEIAGVTGSYEGIIPVTETPTVDADFVGGDMVIQPGEGKLLESVTVRKPADLIPENIKYGVDIAGIIGALTGTGTDTGGDAGTGGGSGTTGSMLKIKTGIFTANSSGNPGAVAHGLGTMPDFVCVQYVGLHTGTAEEFVNARNLMFSWAIKSEFGTDMCRGTMIPGMGLIEANDITVTAERFVYCPNDEVFRFGASSGNGMLQPNGAYRWMAISGLGSAVQSKDLRYVTFMNDDGTVELGKKAVATGDDCADPISRGIFTTPTKASTPQYTYTFAGWATQPNGGLNSNALKAVTEDRTVYANFASVLRCYTITFYDSDGTTVLATKSVAYGSVPSYTAEKEGLVFVGWNPEPVAVTGDASYQAVWSENITFAGATWADIARISQEGKAAQYFKIGDTRDITYTDGAGTSRTTPVKIIGFDHDETEDGTKVGISLMITTPAWYAPMNDGKVTYNGVSQYYSGGWFACHLRNKLNTTVFNSLDESLKSVIKQVKKESSCGIDASTTDELVTYDKLWVPSLPEIGKSYNGFPGGDGKKYEGIPSSPYLYLESGSKAEYWLRSGKDISYGIYYSGNGLRTILGTNNAYVAFGFCI